MLTQREVCPKFVRNFLPHKHYIETQRSCVSRDVLIFYVPFMVKEEGGYLLKLIMRKNHA